MLPKTHTENINLFLSKRSNTGARQQYIIRFFTNQSGVYLESMTDKVSPQISLGTACIFIIEDIADT